MFRISASLSLTAVLSLGALQADELQVLDTLEVNASKSQTSPYGTYLNNTHVIDHQMVQRLAGEGGSNFNKILGMLPSVNSESHDPYGLTQDQNTLRVRGQVGDSFSRAANTIEGVPFSINVGNGAGGYLTDLENISAMEFFNGIIPSNQGFGLGNTAGSLNLRLNKPGNDFGLRFKQAVGSDAFTKSYGRIDTGMVNGFGGFVSASTGSNDKWRGEGEISRDNLSAMVSAKGESYRVDFYGAHNSFDRHEYRALSYAQTRDLGANYTSDYTTQITGTAAQDMYYYDFNKQASDEYFYMLNVESKVGDGVLRFKPYTFGNDGYRMFGSAGAVMKMSLVQDVVGGSLEMNYPLADGTLIAGWWYQSGEMTPPPELQKKYTINPDGSLTYAATTMLTKVDDRISSSPYVAYAKKGDALSYNVGVRYLDFAFPAVVGYNTAGLPEATYGDDLYAQTTEKTGMKVDASHAKLLLPSLALSYKTTPSMTYRGGYSRNYANPWQGPLWSVYNSNTAAFTTAGITLQDLWDDLKLETADTLEMGAKYEVAAGYLAPTLFYSQIKNKQTTVYDPNVGLSYYGSGAEATSYGIELEGGYAYKNMEFFASTYYNRYTFDDDIKTQTGFTEAAGNQVPDVPRYGVKAGMTYEMGDLTLTPTIRYLGARYGDVNNAEQADAYYVVDLGAAYSAKNLWGFKEVAASFMVQNLTDEAYIGVVKNSLDDTTTGATTYYQGAPLSATASLSFFY